MKPLPDRPGAWRRCTWLAVSLLAWPVGALAATEAGPAPAIPFKDDGDLGAQLLRVAVVFLVLAALFVAGVAGWSRLRGKVPFVTRNRRLAVVETLRLSPRTTLFLVEMDGEALLLSQQGNNVAVLASRIGAPAARSEVPRDA